MSIDVKHRLPVNIARAILTPFSFSLSTGHLVSTIKGRSVDMHNNPVPKYTYPVIDLLVSKQEYLSDCCVLEFGAGHSTLWWEKRCKRVVSIERNRYWAEYVSRRLTKSDVVDVRFCRSEEQCLDTARSGSFDIVIVDAEPRIKAAGIAPQLLKENGIIIIDNSDIQRLNPILSILSSAGFKRVDFYGYSPCAFYRQCTSIFFKTMDFWNTEEIVMACSPLSFRS